VDTFDNESWTEGKFGSLVEAVAYVRRFAARREQMYTMHIYDCSGNRVGRYWGVF
jgi:hypothetical protein